MGRKRKTLVRSTETPFVVAWIVGDAVVSLAAPAVTEGS